MRIFAAVFNKNIQGYVKLSFLFLIGFSLLYAFPVSHFSDKHELYRTGAGHLEVKVGLEIKSITEVTYFTPLISVVMMYSVYEFYF